MDDGHDAMVRCLRRMATLHRLEARHAPPDVRERHLAAADSYDASARARDDAREVRRNIAVQLGVIAAAHPFRQDA